MTVDHSRGVALITGAANGIGSVYADRLAHRGYDLLLVDFDRPALETVAARLRNDTDRAVEMFDVDLSDPDALGRVELRLMTDARITVLVNNAGLSLNGGLLAASSAEVRNLIAVNVTASTLLAAAAAKAFMGRKAGVIINMVSTTALASEHADATYAASKGYLLNLTRKLAVDLRGSGVHIQAVLPGAVRTEIWGRSGKDVDALFPGQVMEVGDLVDAALVGLDRKELVTIPPLADEALWTAHEEARLAMAPFLTRREVAPRYRRDA